MPTEGGTRGNRIYLKRPTTQNVHFKIVSWAKISLFKYFNKEKRKRQPKMRWMKYTKNQMKLEDLRVQLSGESNAIYYYNNNYYY
jgi:hypothetical protein